jgi:DNA-binding beta-propeller fold protein YncE
LVWEKENRVNQRQPGRRFTPAGGAGLLFILLVASATAAQGPAALELVQTIPLRGPDGRLDHLALDAKGSRLFVANLSNNSLDVVDLKAGKLLTQVPGQKKIQGVAYAPDLDRIFTGNGDGVCHAFDGRSYEQLHTLKLPGANNVRYDRPTRQVYVGHAPNSLTAFDAKTYKVNATIKLPGPPRAFQIHPDQPRLYVNTLTPGQVVVVDTAKNEIAAKFPLTLAEANSSLALDPEGGRAFVGCRKKPSVVVLDLKTGKEVASVPIPGDVDDLFYDAKRRRLYASCGEGVLAVVGVKEDGRCEVAERVATPEQARTCLFDSGSGRLYLAVPRQKGREGPEVRVFQARP